MRNHLPVGIRDPHLHLKWAAYMLGAFAGIACTSTSITSVWLPLVVIICVLGFWGLESLVARAHIVMILPDGHILTAEEVQDNEDTF